MPSGYLKILVSHDLKEDLKVIQFEVDAKNPDFIVNNGVRLWVKHRCNQQLYGVGSS